MSDEVIGILHPGEMGVFVGASACRSGNIVYWVSAGRSPETAERANKYGLVDAGSITKLCDLCTLIISVCPPHAAESVADQVLSVGFKGVYVDANAISPQRSIQIGAGMKTAGINFVDGGIVGGPVWEGSSTCLYLSGEYAHRVAACFVNGHLQVIELGGELGKASAIKMCYAAYTKGTTALISSILAASEYYGVREVLKEQWGRDWPGFETQAEARATRVTAKAWRFAGEMKEISATFMSAGLPGGFHAAASEIYSRLAGFKGRRQTPDLSEVLDSLLLGVNDEKNRKKIRNYKNANR